MAIDNILHMIGNYRNCSVCQMVVLVWLMDDEWVRQSISDGIAAMGMEMRSVTLVCNRGELTRRWNNDDKCEWRTDKWFSVSLKSLPQFMELGNCIDTSDLTAAQAAEAIMK